MKAKVRIMAFGKYKGQPILRVIAEHIGYIMWCFENIKSFSLNDAEQKFYDWQAIAIKKYHSQMAFPVELMYKHVKDQAALRNLVTPYVYVGRDSYLPNTEISHLLKEAGVIPSPAKTSYETKSSEDSNWRMGLALTTRKFVVDFMDEEETDEIEAMGIKAPIDYGLLTMIGE